MPTTTPSALDALATLAATKINSTPDREDLKAMPPPPPRRMRSASNPEGMEKWDSYQKSSRRHFVLPYSILEEELASANIACQEHAAEQKSATMEDRTTTTTSTKVTTEYSSSFLQHFQEHQPPKKRGLTIFRMQEENNSSNLTSVGNSMSSILKSSNTSTTTSPSDQDELGTSPTSVLTPMLSAEERTHIVVKDEDEDDALRKQQQKNDVLVEEEDESDLEPEELLKRARSRLLEDLATETGVQKGVAPLPHALNKYKSIYNKNGRIGVYTPVERAAIIAKFNSKRGRRVWNKKIRYNCRKNLADRRMRVKGRFVKRAVEKGTDSKTKTPSTAQTSTKSTAAVVSDNGGASGSSAAEATDNSSSASSTRTNSPITTTATTTTDTATTSSPSGKVVFAEDKVEVSSISETKVISGVQDVDMPDVNDPEAGFDPTPDQPFRRVRRHTII